MLEAGPFRSFKKYNTIKFKAGVKEHLLCNPNEINDKIFQAFIHLNSPNKKDSVSHNTSISKITANRIAFKAIFDDFTIFNFHRYFHSKVRYGYIHDDNKIELLKCDQDIITKDYSALILFKNNQIFILRKQFKKFIDFNSCKGSFCSKCGMLFSSLKKHLEYCPVIGTKLSIGLKVGRSNNLKIKNFLKSLGIEEDKNSKEPDIFLRHNISLDSCAVIHVTDYVRIYRTLFNLFFYNNTTYSFNLKTCNMSKKCTNAFKNFIRIYKEVNLQNLELFFDNVRLKFYIKCEDSNRMLPLALTKVLKIILIVKLGDFQLYM